MKYKFILFLTVACSSLLIATLDYAAAQNINIDLGNVDGTPSNTFGAASGQAGVWNTLGNGVTSNLLDITGAVTAVSASVTSNDDTGEYDSLCGGDLHAFRDDNIYTSVGGTWTVTLSGLTDGRYTVYLYDPTHPGVPTGNMLVNGVAVPSINGVYTDCSFNSSNYRAVVVSVTGGTLTISGHAPTNLSGLAGLQLTTGTLVPTMTEWGMIIFMALAGLGAVYYLKRQKRT